jgi:hypothetical protein
VDHLETAVAAKSDRSDVIEETGQAERRQAALGERLSERMGELETTVAAYTVTGNDVTSALMELTTWREDLDSAEMLPKLERLGLDTAEVRSEVRQLEATLKERPTYDVAMLYSQLGLEAERQDLQDAVEKRLKRDR